MQVVKRAYHQYLRNGINLLMVTTITTAIDNTAIKLKLSGHVEREGLLIFVYTQGCSVMGLEFHQPCRTPKIMHVFIPYM